MFDRFGHVNPVPSVSRKVPGSATRCGLLHFLTQPLVDRADLLDEAATVAVLQLHDLFQRPVEVVGDEGYLLVELFEGVAYDSPGEPTSMSTSNRVEQDGQVAAMRVWPFSLTRR